MSNIIIAVDANIILSALLGGKPSRILFYPQFQFVTTEFTFMEVEKYLPRLAIKLRIPQEILTQLLLELPIKIFPENFYKDHLTQANQLIGQFDEKDANILALALKFKTYLWSQDKHFEKTGYLKLLKTYHFIKYP